MRRLIPVTLVAVLSLTVVLSGSTLVEAASRILAMKPGDQLDVSCDTGLSGTMDVNHAHMMCATVGPVITATATRIATFTATATSTATSTATALATATATATATLEATATTIGTATPILILTPTPGPTQVPVAGQACPLWVHDQYKTAGPDGNLYPTWHPPIDPQYGCFFGHEHGDDPRTSTVNSSMPAFGYAAAVNGMTEPHTGYKVFRINVGEHDGIESDVHGSDAISDYAFRLVFHMGTSGQGRAQATIHSMQGDFAGAAGEYHIYGLADTGPTAQFGSTCTTPRNGAKDFSLIDCPDTYEIWTGTHFEISSAEARATCCTGPFQTPLYASFTPAVFDPITSFDPADLTMLIYTEAIKPPNVGGVLQGVNPLSAESWAQGCNREFYSGPNYWGNQQSLDSSPTDYWTDALGVIGPNGGDAAHPIHQYVSHNAGVNQEIFKKHESLCGSGIHAPN